MCNQITEKRQFAYLVFQKDFVHHFFLKGYSDKVEAQKHADELTKFFQESHTPGRSAYVMEVVLQSKYV